MKETSFVMDATKGLAYIYSHLVYASKFTMVQVAHKQKGGIIIYNPPSASCEGIKCILAI
jgi:hypothetical protein